jgi:tetratricopeptide (TPR) repeat protein
MRSLALILGAILTIGCGTPVSKRSNIWAPSKDDELATLPPKYKPAGVAEAQRKVLADTTPKSLIYLGSAHLYSGDGIKALNTFDRCLKIEPENVGCRVGRAQALFAMKRYKQAAIEYRQVASEAKTRRGESLLLDQAGLSSWLSGDLVLAEKDYRRALEVDPRNQLSWLGLGRVLGQTGRYSEAIEAFEMASKVGVQRMQSKAALWATLTSLELGDVTSARARRDRLMEENLSDNELRILREVIEPKLEER